MKCHWCGKDFEKAIYHDSIQRKYVRNHYTCPDDHGEFHLLQDGTLDGYTFFFFSDEVGHKRYKIEKIEGGHISLYIRNIEKPGSYYKKILDIPNPPPMEVKDNIPQVQRMYERLKKLAVFA